MAGEIFENCLPPSLLLLDGVRRFAVKGDADDDAFGVRGELDLRHAIAKRIFDQLMLDDLRVGPGEIEAHAAVLGSMREEKAPPSRKSTEAPVVCQSSDA